MPVCVHWLACHWVSGLGNDLHVGVCNVLFCNRYAMHSEAGIWFFRFRLAKGHGKLWFLDRASACLRMVLHALLGLHT